MNYRLSLTICFLAMLSFFSKPVFASHSMGADLTYSCLGGNNYKLRLSFYRDCSGIAAPTNVTIKIKSVSCGDSLTAVLLPIPGTGQEITPICSSVTSTCNGGTYTGIREWIYEGTVLLPSQCPDWSFSYNLCCRNGAISTIVNPLAEEICIHSMLNNTISGCNNSPTFMNKPVPFVCAGQQFCYNHGAYDSDGDSLAYSLINPLGTGGVPVIYLPPYSATQPMNSAPAMTFNPLTGDFCATPQSIEVTVMAVLIKEYRNGVLIGEVERDMQITVRPCGNNLPDLTGINGTNNFGTTICAGAPFCFDIFSTDPDSNQNITVTWDNTIPAGTFNSVGAPLPVSTFCWTPTAANVSNTPHCFTVMVKDDACPYYGSQIYSYCLTVVNVTANAGPDQTLNCTGTATITATGTTTTGSYTYLWSNGITTASQNVSPGTYTVTVSNGFCTASDVVQINLNSGITVAFNNTNSCFYNPVNFTNASVAAVGTITGYSWSFGDGSSSTLQNPSHVYASAGTYNVCLQASSSAGCFDSICKSVIILPPPVANFTINNDCAGKALNLTNTSTAAMSLYSWNFGNGTTSTLQSPVLSYPNAGTYNISLIVTDATGCKDTVQYPVTTFPLPVVNLTNPIICPSSSVLLNAGNPGSGYQWSTGATSQSLTTSVPGTYSVTVTNSFGCSATGQSNVGASSLTPNTQTVSICQGTSTTFNAGNVGSNYLWSTGATTQSISVTNPGAYTVTVSDANACSISFVSTLLFNPKPVVNFSNGATCLNDSVAFVNVSSVSAGTLTGFNWKFGDGSISQLQQPHHKYASAGVYNVCLIVTTNNGCVDSICKSITIHTPPSANFTVNNDCKGNTLSLVNTSTPSGLSSYSWNFGNGSTSIVQSPVLSYNSAGNYSINLIVTDVNGCSDTIQNPVTIFLLPQVTASSNLAICAGQSATLSANGASAFSWSSGATGQSIIVSPSATTNYIVTGTDGNGCTDTAIVNVVVNALPVVNIGNPVICPSSSIILNAGNSGSNYLWSTGATSQSITTLIAGTYSVTVTNNYGCTATGQSIVGVSALTPNVQTVSICQGTTAIFNAANSGGNYNWSTGATTQAISATNSGAYTVTVSDASGCSISFTSSLIVNPLPVVNFTSSSVCLNDTTMMINSSSISSGLLTTYHWDFGDGNSSTEQSPKHRYLNAGTFNTTLSVISDSGCAADKSSPSIVHPKPIADFASAFSCAGEAMILNDLSSVSTGSILSRKWNFGDSSSVSSAASPSHIYPLAGVYHVTLISVSNFGCSDTISKPVLVNPNPITYFSFDKAEGCGPLTIKFKDLTTISPGNIIAWQWSFGDGNSSTLQNPSNTYVSAGTYTVTLIATSSEGCTNTYTALNAITVYPAPVAEFISTPDEPNILQQVSFDNQSINAISYQWSFGDTTFSKMENPVHNYNYPGTYMVILASTNQYGCVAYARHEIIVVPTWTVYIPNAFTPNDDDNNDIFKIEGIGITKYNMKIFNRWGDKIYDADNRGWDGQYQGRDCKQDVYIYKVEFEVNIGGSYAREGQVSLLK